MSPSREAGTERGRRRGSARGQPTPKTGPQWWMERWQRWAQEMDLAPTSRQASSARLKRLEVGPSLITAVVQDRNDETCRLEIRIAPWTDVQWEAALDAIGAQNVFGAQFSAGELPIELDALLEEAGAPLLPTRRNEIEIVCQGTGCTPDNCRHAPLVFAQLGEALVDDPWMLLRMRGRDQTQLLADLRKPRVNTGESATGEATSASGLDPATKPVSPASPSSSASASSTSTSTGGRFHRHLGESGTQEDVPPLTDQIAQFWGVSKALEGYRPILAEPKVDAVLLRRLGPLPVSSVPEDDIYDELAAVYRRVTRVALRRAFAADSHQEK